MKDVNFKIIELSDKEVINAYLHKDCSACLASFSFANLVGWQKLYNSTFAIANETLLIQFTDLEDQKRHLMQPLGVFPKELQERLYEYIKSLDYELHIYGVSDRFLSAHPDFAAKFEKTSHRDMDNYIYLAEDLALLKGKNYQPKRNLISQLEKTYTWTAECISETTIPDCLEVLHKIYDNDPSVNGSTLKDELEALKLVLNNFNYLEQKGVLIKVDGVPASFSIFEYLNCNTCVVHYEKAMKQYKGLYQLINRETAKIINGMGCKYINREEDLGIEGLRKAKLSYHPIELCEANALVFKKP